MTGHAKEPWAVGDAGHDVAYSGYQFADCDSPETAHAVAAAMNALAGKNPAALDALIEAAVDAKMTFEHYAELHQAKGTAEGNLKGKRNRDMATKLATALANFRNGDAQ